jgi:hypothetical protein
MSLTLPRPPACPPGVPEIDVGTRARRILLLRLVVHQVIGLCPCTCQLKWPASRRSPRKPRIATVAHGVKKVELLRRDELNVGRLRHNQPFTTTSSSPSSQAGKITPGLSSAAGSRAALMDLIAAISALERDRLSHAVLARPTPCSALMLPFTEAT